MTLSKLASIALALVLPLGAMPLAASGSLRAYDASRASSPFATSLQIVAPGPRAEPDGMSYRLTLAWSSRAGAAGYRVFTWTDAARAWYRGTQTSATRADVRAFRSGCTAFVVVAVTDTGTNLKSFAGLDTTNVVHFPLSTRRELCPTRL